MTGPLRDQARRISRAERRWLADARERLSRSRHAGLPARATSTTRTTPDEGAAR